MGRLLLLLRPGILGFKNRLGRTHGAGLKKPLFMGGLGLAFGLILFVLSSRVLVYFQSVEMIGDLLAKELLSMVFLTFFSLLIFSNIITALSNLYLSKDLEFCHSAPVSIETLFAARAMGTFVNSSWMALIFAVPILGAYGYVYAPGVGFYAALLHLMVAMGLIASASGILLTMILVHVFPAQRTRDVILLLSILMVVGLYLLFRFLRPERLVDPETALSVMQYVSALKTPDSPYLPTHWITEILWGRLQGGGTAGEGFYLLLTWSTALALVVINIWTASFIYFGGFSKAQEAKKRLMGGKRVLEMFIRLVTKPFKPDLSNMMAKDMRVFFRDNTQWSQLLLLFALVVVYVYNFKVLPLEKSPLPLDFLQNGPRFSEHGTGGLCPGGRGGALRFYGRERRGSGLLDRAFLFHAIETVSVGEILFFPGSHALSGAGVDRGDQSLSSGHPLYDAPFFGNHGSHGVRYRGAGDRFRRHVSPVRP